MFTRSAIREITVGFIEELKQEGFHPTRAVLFGSYAKGRPHEYSDIDLAVWDERFSGCGPIDIELLHTAKRKFPPLLEIHTFHSGDSVDTNPFIGEILKYGIDVPV
jgi:uncharacterized protein